MALTTINRPDSQKALFGTGNDLEIYHNGSNSYISNTHASSFYIQSNGALLLEHTNGENYFKGNANAATELYYDGTSKLETDSNGVTVTGRISVSGNSGTGLKYGDSIKAVFGTGSDMEILHDGTDTYINNGTGDLYVRTTGSGDDLHLRAVDDVQIKVQGAEDSVICKGNGAVELYYDNAKKSETYSDGIKVYDDVWLADDGVLRLGTRPEGGDLNIYHNGSHSYALNITGQFILGGDTVLIKDGSNTEVGLKYTKDAAVELYYDDSKKLETTSGGAQVTGNMVADAFYLGDGEKMYFGAGDDIKIYHDSANSNNKVEFSSDLKFRPNGNEDGLTISPNGAVTLYYDDSKKFETYADGIKVYDDVWLPDDGRIRLGDRPEGGDLNIFHNGSKSYIKDLGTGSLRICSNDLRIMNADDDEIMFKAEEDASVTLYSNNVAKLTTTGTGVTVMGSVNETSDAALKTNIEPLNNVLDKIQQITGYKYQFKDTGYDSMGVTAQDVEKVFPELVHGEEGTKTLQYSGLIGALIESVKELSNKVAALEAK